MSDLYKDSFYITRQEKANLVKEASHLGIKTSDMLRRIIDKYFETMGEENAKKINTTRSKKKS